MRMPTNSPKAYLAATILCLIGLTLEFRLWKADFHVPFYYETEGDINENMRMLKQIREVGWVLTNPWLGAPGIQETHDQWQGDTLPFLITKLLSEVTPDMGVTINVNLLINVLITTWVSLYVLRRLGISGSIAVVLALLYAFQPYMFIRQQRHLALMCYCCVPIILLTTLWLCEGQTVFAVVGERGKIRPRWIPGRTLPALLAIVLTGSSGAYYAFFGAGCAMVAGLIQLLRTRQPRRLIDPLVLLGLICLVFALNMSPKVYYEWKHGSNPAAVERSPEDSLRAGLSISEMLHPVPYHGLKSLALAALGKSRDLPSTTEYYETHTDFRIQSLGLVASGGFLLLLLALFSERRLRGHLRLAWPLSRLNIAFVLVGTISGFSYEFATLVTPKIRSWHRLSIFIAFLSIAAVGLVIEHLRRTRVRTSAGQSLFGIALAGILVFGLIDQMPQTLVPPHAKSKAEFHRDRDFARAIEAALPAGAMVFQLPYMPHQEFSEHRTSGYYRSYNHFKPYFHSTRIRWSAGAVRGRGTGEWQRRVAEEPIPQMVDDLRTASFSGIYIDRRGYDDGADVKIIEDLKKLLKTEPVTDDRGDRLFFVLNAPARIQPGPDSGAPKGGPKP